jgi:hypothetical protein
MALLARWGGEDVEVERFCLRIMDKSKSSGSRTVSW